MRDGFFFFSMSVLYEFVCVYVVDKSITFHKVELVKLKYHNFLGLCLSLVAGLGARSCYCSVPFRRPPCYLYFCPVLNSNRITAELLGRTVRYDGRRPHQ